MKETVYLYHMNPQTQEIIERLCQQLDVDVKEISDQDICQKMGYIIGIDGYERLEDVSVSDDMSQEFVFFVGMVSEQLDILLELFKMSGLPFIPYKAMLTENNVEYLFYQLYRNVAHEYQQIAQNKRH